MVDASGPAQAAGTGAVVRNPSARVGGPRRIWSRSPRSGSYIGVMTMTNPVIDAAGLEPTSDVTTSLRAEDDDYPTGSVASPTRTRL